MLIGIDASRANRSHKSGTEWYSYYIIRELAKLDKENQYILYTDKPLLGGLSDLSSEKTDCESPIFKKGFQVIKSPHNNFKAKVLAWPFTFFWTQGRLSLEMLFNSPDVLFVPAHALPIIHPKKSLVTIHDIGFKREEKLYERSGIGAERNTYQAVIDFLVRCLTLGKFGANSFDYLDWSTEFSLKHAKAIITISEFTKNEIKELYKADNTKIKVIYNGYPSDLYKPLSNKPEAERVLSSYGIKQPYIFYVGRLEKKKNIATLIEAFHILKTHHTDLPHRLYLVGDASFGFDDIKYSIHGFGLQNVISTTGWVKEHDLPYIFNCATAFIFPSNYEGFGIPLLQAMASGVPIVASRAASIPEVVGDAAVLFDPASPSDMADALANVLSDENVRKDLIVKGSQRITNYSWSKCAKETLDFISSIV
ncbi:MAG: glycosyltransferase family 1 protein [Candidatus Falkowbacteria bacterium]|nr:glycosyltransferase family 1 protein [Candidatus Falkowbacteria bacterium]